MGHSRICSFDGRLIYGTKEAQVGIESFREAKAFLSDKCQEVNGFVCDKVILWPQTARAKRMADGKDFILIDREGIKRMNVQERHL